MIEDTSKLDILTILGNELSPVTNVLKFSFDPLKSSFIWMLSPSIASVNTPLPIISPGETEILSKIQSNALALPQAPVATSSSVVRGKADPFR